MRVDGRWRAARTLPPSARRGPRGRLVRPPISFLSLHSPSRARARRRPGALRGPLGWRLGPTASHLGVLAPRRFVDGSLGLWSHAWGTRRRCTRAVDAGEGRSCHCSVRAGADGLLARSGACRQAHEGLQAHGRRHGRGRGQGEEGGEGGEALRDEQADLLHQHVLLAHQEHDGGGHQGVRVQDAPRVRSLPHQRFAGEQGHAGGDPELPGGEDRAEGPHARGRHLREVLRGQGRARPHGQRHPERVALRRPHPPVVPGDGPGHPQVLGRHLRV